jgi:ribosomal protein S18 acetylase RimI-like enzyme
VAARERAQRLGCRSLSLICFAQNAGARRLYQREGFTVVDRRDIVPHPMIHATGEALLMTAPV